VLLKAMPRGSVKLKSNLKNIVGSWQKAGSNREVFGIQ
jgi:hypothetical protein